MVADIVGRPLRAMPDAGRLVLVDEMHLYTGGCAVNTATALARLGLPVKLIGKVGNDSLGDFLVNELVQRGINIESVKRDGEVGTSTTMVLVDADGERRFIHYIGANATLSLEDIDERAFENASILHIAGTLVMPSVDGEPTAELLRSAQAAGMTTFLDTVWDDTGRWMLLMEPCLPHIDYFIPSLPEARAITRLDVPEEIAAALLECGVGTVGLKMGADGCLVMTSEGDSIRAPAYDVNVVDATGAGDAFAAGFIAGVWLGWPLKQTAYLANAVGALCVTGEGATGGVRSLEETNAFMEETSLKV
ncbi:MAG: carbohydrate kinase [Anaerolineales bacterium]|nr:carbohydrate kinase [Anaerolineales bacterium]